MNIEQVVAEMPKVKYPTWSPYYPTKQCVWERATEAQCKLLAEQGYVPKGEKDNYWWEQGVISQKQIMLEQGYRKVRSMEELLNYLRQPLLYEQYTSWTSKSFAEELHRFFLEGE